MEKVTERNKVNELEYLLQKKAEEVEQYKREQDILTALEKVQEKAMAMRSSEDISEATAVVFNELFGLGFKVERCGIFIGNETAVWEVWSTKLSPDNKKVIDVVSGWLNTEIHPLGRESYNSWKNKEEFFTYELIGEEVKNYYDLLEETPGYHFPKISSYPTRQILNSFNFEEGGIFVYTKIRLSVEEKNLLHRFARVFSNTYKRYLDIVRAEALAREAQVEAALERVRSKAMAMHNSKDISGATAVIFNELKLLGIETIRAGILIFNETPITEVWSTKLSPKDNQVIDIITGNLNMTIHPMLHNAYLSWKNKEDYFTFELTSNEVSEYYKLLEQQPGYHFPKNRNFPPRQILNSFHTEDVGIFAYTIDSLTQDEKQIIHRFAKVFSHTFKRYIDIIKAERQVHEAQIEASLERVRAKAMAMHSSKDIADATAVVFNELSRLGIIMERCGIVIFKEAPVMEVWATPLSPEKKQVIKVITGTINSGIHVMLQQVYEAWTQKKDFFSYTLTGDEVQNYYDKLERETGIRVPKILNYPEQQIANCFYFNEGYVFVYTQDELSEDDKHVFFRFTKVFSLTYRRYLDLIRAEEQTREAIRQASLDRVRGEIASMRTKNDLKRITPLIWHELTALGISFIRCGVFIMDEKLERIHTYLSTPEGRSLSAFEMDFDEEDVTSEIVKKWRKKEKYQTYWNKKQFIDFMEKLIKVGKVDKPESFKGSAAPPESLYLNFVPFKQGMLYVGNTSSLTAEEIQSVQSLADSFSMAYARYEDFKQLEDAKLQTEITLNELKAAQTQLIHSEKMASLGELTAGIAHEIQNPLNFVSNFSELCNELLLELQEEIDAGNTNNVKLLLEDLIQNLHKINLHGKRAEAIIKAMLMHSRGSNGKKEPTNVNSLADEFLRLSYHGFRAKDKLFSANYKTEFDKSLPKINVIPQDIGRVLLNLINNAFCAAESKAKNNHLEIKPEVVVCTKSFRDHSGNKWIRIVIKDNGPGIPQNIREKIFQPFFTTKPSGQGTGLGLSLGFDIVKAHRGEISFESVEGKGTSFIIDLPLSIK